MVLGSWVLGGSEVPRGTSFGPVCTRGLWTEQFSGLKKTSTAGHLCNDFLETSLRNQKVGLNKGSTLLYPRLSVNRRLRSIQRANEQYRDHLVGQLTRSSQTITLDIGLGRSED